MKNVTVQFLVLLLSFFLLWFLFSRVSWVEVLRIEKISKKTEEKLGELFWETFKQQEKEITDLPIVQPVDSLLRHLCTSNNIEAGNLKLHIVSKSEVNAFALPGGRIVVFTGLLKACENEAELSGVLGHELAHLQHNHVSRKLVKEVGLSVLISMAGGNAGAEIIKETLRLLSSTAFDRGLEKEADLVAADYLINASLNPVSFADFLSRLSTTEQNISAILVWASTHPHLKERATYIKSYVQSKTVEPKEVLNPSTWVALQDSLR